MARIGCKTLLLHKQYNTIRSVLLNRDFLRFAPIIVKADEFIEYKQLNKWLMFSHDKNTLVQPNLRMIWDETALKCDCIYLVTIHTVYKMYRLDYKDLNFTSHGEGRRYVQIGVYKRNRHFSTMSLDVSGTVWDQANRFVNQCLTFVDS